MEIQLRITKKTTTKKHLTQRPFRELSPSFSICILTPLYFQKTEGGGELVTSHTMLALSPSVNSCGEGAFVKVIFSEMEHKTVFYLVL